MLNHAVLNGHRATFGGPPYTPLHNTPVVVTYTDARSYLDEVGTIMVSLMQDYEAKLIVDDAAKDETAAFERLDKAEKLDGCAVPNICTTSGGSRTCSVVELRKWDGTGCPTLTRAEYDQIGDTMKSFYRKTSPAWAAREHRLMAYLRKERAARTYANAKARGVQPVPQKDDVLLWNTMFDTGGRIERWKAIDDKIRNPLNITSESDYNSIQSLDVDLQADRDEYTRITSAKPKLPLPTPQKTVAPNKQKTGLEGFGDQLELLAKLAVGGLAIYYLGPLLLGGMAVASAAKSGSSSKKPAALPAATG